MRELVRGEERYKITQHDGELLVVSSVGGQTKERVRRFVDADKAAIAMKRSVAAKLADGFVEVSSAPIDALPPHERAVVDDPSDDEAWLVLADWLASEDDPRAELISLSVAGQKKKRQREILQDNLATLVENAKGRVYPQKALDEKNLELDFFRGFIAEARVHAKTSVNVGALIESILRLPSARFMQRLHVECPNDHQRKMIFDRAYTLASTFASHPPFALRSFVYNISVGMPLNDMASLIHHCPNLTRLFMKGVLPDFDGLKHGSLAHLIFAGSLGGKGERDLAEAELPALRTLALDPPKSAELDPVVIERFLRKHSLTRLSFSGTKSLAGIASVVLSAPLARIEHLTFAYGGLTDDDVPLFAEHASLLSRLSSLDLSSNRFSPSGITALEGLTPNLILRGHWPSESVDDADAYFYEEAVE